MFLSIKYSLPSNDCTPKALAVDKTVVTYKPGVKIKITVIDAEIAKIADLNFSRPEFFVL